MAVLAWIGLALGLVIAVLVVELFNRVVRPLLEIRRYADDILQAGVAIATNLDGVDELSVHATGTHQAHADAVTTQVEAQYLRNAP